MPATPIKSLDVSVETTKTVTVTETTTYEVEAQGGLRYAVIFNSSRVPDWKKAAILAVFGDPCWARMFINSERNSAKSFMRILDTVTGIVSAA
jgi:hypothetical protein